MPENQTGKQLGQEPEPWLRGTRTEVDAVRRAVLHALDQAEEDVVRWCGELSDAEIHERPAGVASVAFHLKHLARSLDRLMTYAEGGALNEQQMILLRSEQDGSGSRYEVMAEFDAGVQRAKERILGISAAGFEAERGVGRARLPTTAGGLIVHCAEHTMRHVGQAITTVKIVTGDRESAG